METVTRSQQARFGEDEGRGETEAEETEKAAPAARSESPSFTWKARWDVRPKGSAVSGSHPHSAAAHQAAHTQPIDREHAEPAVLSRGGQTRSSEA